MTFLWMLLSFYAVVQTLSHAVVRNPSGTRFWLQVSVFCLTWLILRLLT